MAVSVVCAKSLINNVVPVRWMESVAKGATTEALTKLIELEPTTALLVSSGNHEEKEINKQLVARGDLIKVIDFSQTKADCNEEPKRCR